MKIKFKTLFVLIITVVSLGVITLTGAWYFNSTSQDITITLANGIQLEATGLKKDDAELTGALQNSQTYQLTLTNNSAVAPGATITVKNVTLKTKSNVNSANSFVRYKITYEYSADGTTWNAGTYSSCNMKNEIIAKAATTTAAGFVKVGEWFYYFNHSTSQTYANLAVLNGNAISLFNGDQAIQLTETISGGSQIRLTLTLDAVQATQAAAQAEWSGALS